MDRVDNYPAVARLREDGWFLRGTSAIVVVTFLWLLIYPDLLIAKEAAAQKQARPAVAAGGPAAARPDPLNEALESLQRTVDDVGFGVTAMNRKPELRTIREQLQSAHRQTLAEFAEDAAHIERHNLPEVIRQRYAKALAEYKAKANEALSRVNSVLEATLPSEATDRAHALADWLGQQKTKRSHQPLDPNNLPFSVPDADKTRKPKTSPEDYADLFPAKPILLASAGELDPMLLAQADTPSPEYLQPTEDVQITPAIEAKAAELDHDPVAIYNWMRNNVEFLPTYGSIQGSDLALQTERGNAFDTASLLIALLRASDIPARYVYGTVEIPVDKVMNWVGGVEVPEAALQLLGQGGIPNTGLSQGGRITHVQLEHVWVEAWIDYEPSRGAKHIEGDTWVPMDASFKQYTYTEGMNVDENVPFDAQGFTDQIEASATINEEEGWVQGVDQAYIQNEFQSYLDQVNAYVENQDPDATVGEVLGTKTIDQINPPILAAGLPYKLRARGSDFASIPDSMRTYFHYRLYASERDRTYDSPAIDYRASLPSLANKRITLSFAPATEEDRETIESYMPEQGDDGEIEPNTLPESMPGYLINLTAELRISGQVVAQAGPYAMGTELATRESITQLTGGEFTTQNNPTAGEFHTIGLNYQGVKGRGLEVAQKKAELIKERIKNKQFNLIAKDSLIGDILNLGTISYFSSLSSHIQTINRVGKAVVFSQPGFGSFSSSIKTNYRYGVPRDVLLNGISVDIDIVTYSAKAHDGNQSKDIVAVRQIGSQLSALEHRIPELLFKDESDSTGAISAVKAITFAQSQGQRVFRIDQNNLSSINKLTISQSIESDIRSAINSGKVATIHERPVTISDWSGTGYILIDPETGAGAYRIQGGTNGGELGISFSSIRDGTASALTKGLYLLLFLVASTTSASNATGAKDIANGFDLFVGNVECAISSLSPAALSVESALIYFTSFVFMLLIFSLSPISPAIVLASALIATVITVFATFFRCISREE